MRAAIVGRYPVRRTRIEGGVEAAFSYLVDGLRRCDGLDLHILTLGDGTSKQPERVAYQGVTVHILAPYPRFEFTRDYRIYQARMDEALTYIGPDVVHAQDAAQDAYVALRSGYPAVITVHGIRREDGKYLTNFLLRLRNRLHSTRIENYNLRHAKYLIAISHYVTDYFADLLRPETKVYYIPNAISQRFFQLEGGGDGHTVLFMGRVIRRKRPLDLVHALAQIIQQIPRARLRIAGECSTDPECVASVRAYIQEMDLGEHIHLLGPLAERDVLDEFARCDVLALPSSQETAPMVIAQAMAAGKPVIATAVGGIPEMVSDAETGYLVDVGDVAGLTDALRSLLLDPSLRARMGLSGRQKAEANYRAAIVAKRTYQVYQDIAGRR